MFMYFLIGLCLVLVGIAGLQFTYLFYVDRLNQERRKYLAALENRCNDLAARLARAERRVAEQDELSLAVYGKKEDEAWAELIDDR
jgi:hypothetical protein